MPMLQIEGRKVRVSDDFLKMSPDQQSAAVDEIAASIGIKAAEPFPVNGNPAIDMKGRPDRWSAANEATAGATFGMSIPIVAAATTPFEMIRQGTLNPIDAYKSARDQMDADRAAYGKENPATGVLSNLAGGLATGGLAAKGGATLMGRFGSSPVARVGEAAAEGAAYGGLTGLGESRGSIGQHAAGGLEGVGIGAVLGGGLASAGQLIGAGASGIGSAVKGIRDPEGFAANKVVQAMQRDGMTVDDLTKAARGASPDTIVADVGGENARRLLRSAGNVPGPAANDIADAMGDRMSGQRQRMMTGVSKKLAPGELYNATLDDIAAKYRADASPLYKAAYAKPVPYDDFALDALMPRIPKQAWGEANRLMQIEGYQPKQVLANIADDGTISINRVPDMRQWDYVKRGLDSMISAEDGKGAMGGTTPVGRALGALKNELLSVLDKGNPSYAAARKFSSDMIGLKKASELGADMLRMPKDEAAKAFQSLSAREKEVARIGLAKSLRNKILAGSDGSDRVKAVWNEQTRQLLQSTFDKRAFRDFARFMESERAKMLTVQAARGNSTSAQQLAGLLDSGIDPAVVSIGGDLAKGNLWGATLGAVTRWARKMGGLNEKSAGAMADVLMTPKKDISSLVPRLKASESAIRDAQGRSIGVYPALPRAAALLGTSYTARPSDRR